MIDVSAYLNFDPLNLDDLKKVLKILKKPRNFKKFGQNFLLDQKVRDSILSAANLSKQDQVLEIGPGAGVLTGELTKKAGRVVAIDIDPYMLELTRLSSGAPDNLELKLQDVRKINLPKLFCGPAHTTDKKKSFSGSMAGESSGQDTSKTRGREVKQSSNKVTGKSGEQNRDYVAVSNLPFLLTGFIFELLLTSTCSPKRMVVMVQKEVADRILAEPGEHSLLSLSVNIFGQPKKIAEVSRESFWPVPKVDSSVIKIDRFDRPLIGLADQKLFFRVARAGFSAKRKKLLNALQGGLGLGKDLIKKALAESDITENTRAQELSVEKWAKLSQKLANNI